MGTQNFVHAFRVVVHSSQRRGAHIGTLVKQIQRPTHGGKVHTLQLLPSLLQACCVCRIGIEMNTARRATVRHGENFRSDHNFTGP